MIHVLKCHPAPFDAAWEGLKPYEVRNTRDRSFHVGDELMLMEFDPHLEVFSGRRVDVVVTYITEPGQWGLPNHLCVMGTRVLDRIGEDHRPLWPAVWAWLVKTFARGEA